MIWDKSIWKYSTSFCVGKTLQGTRSNLMNILSETLSKKTNISFASGCQLEIASWFGNATCFPFSLNTGSPWTSEDPLHAVTVSLDSRVSVMLCLGNIVYLAYLVLSGFHDLSASSSTQLSKSKRSSLMNIFHVFKVFKDSPSLHTV